jgi:DNA-3-methyladenine glycosylase II
MIIKQQLKHAESILESFMDALGCKASNPLSPQLVLAAKFEIRIEEKEEGVKKKRVYVNGKPVALSEMKAKYLQSLAEHFNDPLKLKDVDLYSLSEVEAESRLTAVHGIGVFTAKMYLLSELQMANVCMAEDEAMRGGAAKFFSVSEETFKGKEGIKELHRRMEAFAPYKSIASLYMFMLNFKG